MSSGPMLNLDGLLRLRRELEDEPDNADVVGPAAANLH
jgi:hypothetical protein